MINIDRIKIAEDNSKMNVKVSFPQVFGEKKAVMNTAEFIIDDPNDIYDSISVSQIGSLTINDYITVYQNTQIVIGVKNISLANIGYVIAQDLTFRNILKIKDFSKSIGGGTRRSNFVREDCYGHMNIDYVFVMNQDKYDRDFMSKMPAQIQTGDPFIAECIQKGIFVQELDVTQKDAIKSEGGLDILKSGSPMPLSFEDNLMFVYVHSSDSPSCDTGKCSRCYSAGCTYNVFDMYMLMLGASYRMKKNCCTIEEGFSDYVLQFNRMQIALRLGNESDAIDAWKIIHNGAKGTVSTTSKCSCNG